MSVTGSFMIGKPPPSMINSSGGFGSIAASGLRNLNDCSRSDPAFGARPQQHLVWLAACGLGAATELSWFGDGNRP